MPRPRTFDDVRRAELFAMLSHGLTMNQAARYLGCTLRTIQREAKRDRQFRRDVQSAEISARLDPLKLMHKAANSHWRAAAWLLERTDPNRYAARPAVSCRPDQLEDVAAQLVETALAQIESPEAQRRAYDALTAAAENAAESLFGQPVRPTPQLRRPRPLTPRVNNLRLLDELKQAGDFFGTKFTPEREEVERSESRLPPLADFNADDEFSDTTADEFCRDNTALENDKTVAHYVGVFAKIFRKRFEEARDKKRQNGEVLSPRIDAHQCDNNDKMDKAPCSPTSARL